MSIIEVAKLAGVSNSTVSRVINNYPRVSPDAAKAVREAMETLNYQPSENRPGPKPRSRVVEDGNGATIGFFVFNAAIEGPTPAFEALMRGIAMGVSQFNLRLVYQHITDLDTLPQQVQDGGIDGLLLHGTVPLAAAPEALRRLPTVWLMGNRRRPEWGDQVMPDTYDIGAKAAKYLLSRGHKRLAFLNLDSNHWPHRVTGQSFAAAARDGGGTCDLVEGSRTDDAAAHWTNDAVVRANELVEKFLTLSPRPTGLHVANDMQLSVLQPALQRAGVTIGPGGVDLIGCNNERPYLLSLRPAPAEIDLHPQAIGLRGVERLLWRLSHRDAPERMVTAVEPTVLTPEGDTVA